MAAFVTFLVLAVSPLPGIVTVSHRTKHLTCQLRRPPVTTPFAAACDHRASLLYCHPPYITALAPEIYIVALLLLPSLICCFTTTVVADRVLLPALSSPPARFLPTQL